MTEQPPPLKNHFLEAHLSDDQIIDHYQTRKLICVVHYRREHSSQNFENFYFTKR